MEFTPKDEEINFSCWIGMIKLESFMLINDTNHGQMKILS